MMKNLIFLEELLKQFFYKRKIETRFGSMILDHFIMTLFMIIFSIPLFLLQIFNVSNYSNKLIGPNEFNNIPIYLSLVGFAAYFCKDSINGRSIAKRVFKLQVVNNATNEAASPLKCFIRNIFCIVWPIEVFMALKNPNRRIGDMVAGTKVVGYNPETKNPGVDYLQVAFIFLLTYAIILVLLKLIDF
jgi:uncharacterized RDD family membrane protein YckC